ncbi:hypothetical protein C7S16_5396 [Burkholderia thailandensis]|uniref:Uncharacterized protein n=1 Tax=Burkholderia thailandensis TaxID=57975 RepID=A0AAW9CUM7_BURTH|nr:hypothetical protein [Burkholderia thailandensis]MDW9252738.1 hypothetical protein [Burkholderia thailandensis]
MREPTYRRRASRSVLPPAHRECRIDIRAHGSAPAFFKMA